MDHHAAFRGEVIGEQDVGLAFTQRRGRPHGEGVDGEAALAFIAGALIFLARRIVEFRLLGVDEDGLVGHFTVVDLRAR